VLFFHVPQWQKAKFSQRHTHMTGLTVEIHLPRAATRLPLTVVRNSFAMVDFAIRGVM
jgi:hypothetical protein